MAAHLDATPKYVATRTLTKLSWKNSHVLDGELIGAARKLKSAGGRPELMYREPGSGTK